MNYTENRPWNTSEMADLIIEQFYIGSVIRIVDDPETYGFASVINLHKHKVFIDDEVFFKKTNSNN